MSDVKHYAIMRTAKLKTNGNVYSSLMHALRERETLNADKDLLKNNEYSIPGTNLENESNKDILEKAKKRYEMMLPEKIRKNGVRCVELLMTYSSEYLDPTIESQKKAIPKYLSKCEEWAKNEFGEENIFFSARHYDEKTPHISVFLVPKIDGKLNASFWLDGRKKMSELQDSFYEHITKSFKKEFLSRGIKGSKAKHKSIKQYYTDVNQSQEFDLEIPERERFESHNDYEVRLGVLAAKENRKVKEIAKERDLMIEQREHYKITSESKDKKFEQFKKDLTLPRIAKMFSDIQEFEVDNYFELLEEKRKIKKKSKSLIKIKKNKGRDIER